MIISAIIEKFPIKFFVRWKWRRETFESLRLYCSLNLSNIPLTFMLGFYVSVIVKRWWLQFNLLPWPDSFSIMMTGGTGDWLWRVT